MTTPSKKIGFFTKIDPELREAMRRFKENTGVPEAQQVDRALREWLAERADAWPLPRVRARKPGRARVVTRKRP
jgi:hypothetical protein